MSRSTGPVMDRNVYGWAALFLFTLLMLALDCVR